MQTSGRVTRVYLLVLWLVTIAISDDIESADDSGEIGHADDDEPRQRDLRIFNATTIERFEKFVA